MLKYSQKGFSLAEIVVAIFIIGITSSAAFIVSMLSIRSQVVGQDYSIAVSLAREGIEVVRGIRDTNWLYYSGSRRDSSGDTARDHWNDGFDGVDHFGNDYNTDAVGVGNLMTDDVNYSIEQMTNYFIPVLDYNNAVLADKYRWKLKYIADDLGELYPTLQPFLVYQTSSVDGGIYIQNDTLSGIAPAGGQVTKFYRIIEIRYQESYDQGGNCAPHNEDPENDSLADEDPPGDYNGDGNEDDDGDGSLNEDGFHPDCKLNANDNKILVRSKVVWYDYQGNKLHIDLDATLTDWFRREDHT
jgi:prepilin-type N-terminal cleavage/methylation domain-containing protein